MQFGYQISPTLESFTLENLSSLSCGHIFKWIISAESRGVSFQFWLDSFGHHFVAGWFMRPLGVTLYRHPVWSTFYLKVEEFKSVSPSSLR